MKRPASLRRMAILGLAGLGLFSLLFSIGAALDLWPAPPEGGFQGIDLSAGLAFGVVLALALIFRRDG